MLNVVCFGQYVGGKNDGFTYSNYAQGNYFKGTVDDGFAYSTGISLSTDDSPLLVVLQSFNAVLKNKTVLLDWVTFNEINNDYFIVTQFVIITLLITIH